MSIKWADSLEECGVVVDVDELRDKIYVSLEEEGSEKHYMWTREFLKGNDDFKIFDLEKGATVYTLKPKPRCNNCENSVFFDEDKDEYYCSLCER